MTTFVLSAGETGIVKEAAGLGVVLALALFYGGIAQFAAGMWEFRRGNTFGATAFCSFGAFWLSFWAINRFGPQGDMHRTLALYLFAWFVFTAAMTIAALQGGRAVCAVFTFLTLTFLCLAVGAWQNGPAPDPMTRLGGFLGVLTAALAWYAAFATVIGDARRARITRSQHARPTGGRRPETERNVAYD
jgi:succinate-acetate transporter protein